MRGCFLLAGLSVSLFAADWPTFRGPNASGVSPDTNLIEEFGPGKNQIWKTELPPGHSSPVLVGNRIYLTAYAQDKLFTFALDRASGKVLWRREAPRPRQEKLHKSNSPASPSAASDGRNVFVFFTDFGLLSYGPDGEERWRVPLGPFNNPMGQAATPVLSGNTLLVPCDQESGSFYVALDKDTGKVKWRVERPDFTRGFSTPVLWKAPNGRMQALQAGSYRLVAYDVETGKEEWFVRGLTWQLKPTPVIDNENIYVLGWAGEADPGQQEQVPEFGEVLTNWDKNKDGKLQRDEIGNPKIVKGFDELDLDRDGAMGPRDWQMYQAKRAVVNGVNAFKLGGSGDMTAANTLWKYEKSLPNVPSPLLYQGVLYLCKEGGILTALDAKTGKVLKQGRITGAPGAYFASPIAAGNKIYTVSEEGKMAIIKPGADWEVVKIVDFTEPVNATPAIIGNRIYVRTHNALYCFGKTS
ncbi:MAG: PQQ-binding-like beta-propeller repeat protein [Bryobacterales bacterium]|nr:PQQ-binding-like beta-propeller repeat protein [Bryobacterales bacterium]